MFSQRLREKIFEIFLFVAVLSSSEVQGQQRKPNVPGTCGGRIVGQQRGAIASPGFPRSNYPNDANCTYEIEVDPGQVIVFQSSYMDLESENQGWCYDFLQVFTSESAHEDDAPKLCGSDVIPIDSSEGRNLIIRFVSDHSQSYSGFVITWYALNLNEMRPSFNCDFEGPVPLCPGWTQSKDDDLDWSFTRGPTPSKSTGPSTDHTTGTLVGRYAFMEASIESVNGERKHNKTATLLSPTISLNDSPEYCLSLWYHNLGDGEFYVRKISGRSRELLHSFEENGGDEWHPFRITLQRSDIPISIAIEAKRGASYRSDVAVDDIKLESENCDILQQTTTAATTNPATSASYAENDEFDFESALVSTEPGNIQETCGETFAGIMEGAITSPGFPASNYTSNLNCTYKIVVPIGYVVAYESTVIDLEPPFNGDCYDHILAYRTGEITNNDRIPVYCGNMTIPLDVSTGHELTVVFLSDSSHAGRGFEIRWYALNLTDMQPTFDCDFDGPIPLCPGWEQVDYDDMDWSFNRGPTPSGNTGPPADHTSGTGVGRYAFLEASGRTASGQSKKYKTATLLSPRLSLTEHSAYCLDLWYHNEGDGNLFVTKLNELGQEIHIVSISSDTGVEWQNSRTTLYRSNTEFRIGIEAVRGASYRSDVAVDDISLHPGTCTQNETIPINPPDFNQNQPELQTGTDNSLNGDLPFMAGCYYEEFYNLAEMCTNLFFSAYPYPDKTTCSMNIILYESCIYGVRKKCGEGNKTTFAGDEAVFNDTTMVSLTNVLANFSTIVAPNQQAFCEINNNIDELPGGFLTSIVNFNDEGLRLCEFPNFNNSTAILEDVLREMVIVENSKTFCNLYKNVTEIAAQMTRTCRFGLTHAAAGLSARQQLLQNVGKLFQLASGLIKKSFLTKCFALDAFDEKHLADRPPVSPVRFVTPDRKGCMSYKLDLMILFDGSGSVTTRDFPHVINFIKEIVALIDLTASQVGVMQYSHWYSTSPLFRQPYLETVIRLGEFESQYLFVAKANKIKRHGWTTYTAHAIQKAQLVELTSSAGFLDSCTKKAIIVITDGSASDSQMLATSAQNARVLGTTLYAVGVKNYVSRQLQIIANGRAGNNERVHRTSTFRGLPRIIPNIRDDLVDLITGGRAVA